MEGHAVHMEGYPRPPMKHSRINIRILIYDCMYASRGAEREREREGERETVLLICPAYAKALWRTLTAKLN